jgi:CspA family cold shock protein
LIKKVAYLGAFLLDLLVLDKSKSMETGTIARLTPNGYGFISREGQDKDLFFHATELNGVEFNDLKEGEEVTFEVTETPKGMNATNVSRAGNGGAGASDDDADDSDDSSEE